MWDDEKAIKEFLLHIWCAAYTTHNNAIFRIECNILLQCHSCHSFKDTIRFWIFAVESDWRVPTVHQYVNIVL